MKAISRGKSVNLSKRGLSGVGTNQGARRPKDEQDHLVPRASRAVSQPPDCECLLHGYWVVIACDRNARVGLRPLSARDRLRRRIPTGYGALHDPSDGPAVSWRGCACATLAP